MTESKKASPVSKEEIEKMEKEDRDWDLRLALGYLVELRTSSDKDITLKKVHDRAVAALIPGSDYDSYVYTHGQAFDYLKEHADEYKIKVE